MTIEDEYRAAESHISAWDGWITEPERDWGTLFTLLRSLALVTLAFCFGVLLAFAWGSSQ